MLYVEQLRACGIDRVLLVTAQFVSDPTEEAALIDSLRENIAFFAEQGIRAGVWIGSTIGHGSHLAVPSAGGRTQGDPLVNLDGHPIADTLCPLDPDFRRVLCRHIARIAAETGTELIQLDDDLRLSQHGASACCCCERHRAQMEKLCGESLAGKDLRSLVFGGRPNRYRAAWLRAQGDSLRGLAREIREAVDAVAPQVRISVCSAQCLWEQDGSSAEELAVLLAGQTRPIARLYGAPYWAIHAGKSLPWVFENARCVASFCSSSGIELWAEGDVYPRPRCMTPSSCLELYDAMIRADGQYDGILKYMVDYSAPPDYETGYLRRHAKDLADFEAIDECFAGRAAVGVEVVARTARLASADLTLSGLTNEYDSPTAGILLSQNAIPTVYGTDGIGRAIFGENARGLSAGELRGGAMLDGVAACILTEQGIDVGLSEGMRPEPQRVVGLTDGDRIDLPIRAEDVRMLDGRLDPRAERLLWVRTRGGKLPLAYRYTNADGARFLVWMYDALSLKLRSALTCGSLIRRTLVHGLEWIAQARLPVSCADAPELYLLTKRDANGTAILLLNCFADAVEDGELVLDVPNARVTRALRCRAEVQGDRLRLLTPIPAFSFAMVELAHGAV